MSHLLLGWTAFQFKWMPQVSKFASAATMDITTEGKGPATNSKEQLKTKLIKSNCSISRAYIHLDIDNFRFYTLFNTFFGP